MKVSEDEKLQKEILDLYTPLSVAKEEIWRRWNDKKLKKKIEDFLGNDIPLALKKNPKAILARHILSPNFELLRFCELSNLIKLDPLCFEYIHDKFIAGNTDKYHLCRLFFHNGNGKKGGAKIETINAINFNGAEGKELCDLKTLNNENFIDFHHNLMSCVDLITKPQIFDITKWYKDHGKTPEKYYMGIFALYICHGVLFENFRLSEETEFTKKIVLPSFKKIKDMFGLKPLIVPLVPAEDEDQLYWWCYPGTIKEKDKKFI